MLILTTLLSRLSKRPAWAICLTLSFLCQAVVAAEVGTGGSTGNQSLANAKPEAPKMLLKGKVQESRGPLLEGSATTLSAGTKVNLTLMANLNSEVSKKGDQIFARVSLNVKDGQKVIMPGGWYVHGTVTDVCGQRRMGRNGWVEVQFDRLISPDGSVALPLPVKFSTKDNELKAVSKVVAVDSGYVAEGAVAGALLSTELTGIPVAIATHGLSLAVGGAAGASLGLFGALKRFGKVASLYPGDEIKLNISEPIELPGFDPVLLPSNQPHRHLDNLSLRVKKISWGKDLFQDKKSRLLTLKVDIDNHTKQEVSFFDLAVESDNGERYFPALSGLSQVLRKKVPAESEVESTISFTVSAAKHKYFLLLLDRGNRSELTRIAINP